MDGLTLTLEDTPATSYNGSRYCSQENTVIDARGVEIKQLPLPLVNRVKSLALEGIRPEDIIKIVIVSLADVEKILTEEIPEETIELLGIERLKKEYAAYVEFKSKLEEVEEDGSKEDLANFYKAYQKGNILIIPRPITYLDISEYKATTKSTVVENTEGMLASLRRKLIGNLLNDANNDLIPRRDAVSILRVIGTNEDNNKAAKQLVNLTQNNNQTNFTVMFDEDKLKGKGALTISEEGEVLGIDGAVTDNISRSDLMEMVSNLTE